MTTETPVKMKALVHFLIPSDSGNIKSRGIPGSRHVEGPEATEEQKRFDRMVDRVERTFDVACLSGAKLPKHATGETGPVTCPKCLESAAYKAAVAKSTDSGAASSFRLEDLIPAKATVKAPVKEPASDPATEATK